MEGFLTVNQIAERLDVTPDSVYNWLRSGKLAGFKAGVLWRVTEEQLQAFLNHGHRASQQSGD